MLVPPSYRYRLRRCFTLSVIVAVWLHRWLPYVVLAVECQQVLTYKGAYDAYDEQGDEEWQHG